MSRNHYEILGVRQSDTDASIRSASSGRIPTGDFLWFGSLEET